jgi:Tfp pilus assembly protein PilX
MTRAPSSFRFRQGQRGVTLIIALVMLVALAMLGIWAYNGSTTNTRIVGNMQVRQEALDAAQAALETTISSALFTTAPAAVAASAVNVEVNGVNYAVSLKDKNGDKKPACYRAKPIKSKDLNFNSEADRKCMQGTPGTLGIESEVPPTSITTGDSLCSETEWNVYAEVTDPQTGAFVAVNQGVGARVLTTAASDSCPSS